MFTLLKDSNERLLIWNKVKFYFFFKNKPTAKEYCNAKKIRVLRQRDETYQKRKYLVFIRCGDSHLLSGEPAKRNFDIALSCYSEPETRILQNSDYIISGGMNKFMAAKQFLSKAIISSYEGFMFLDDDLEISYEELSKFMNYCFSYGLSLAQPSLSPNSHILHKVFYHTPGKIGRTVKFVEVMCPYFSREGLEKALPSFSISYSTWGINNVWPQLLGKKAYVLDKFQIKHSKPMQGSGPFYKYMTSIGIRPINEVSKTQKWLKRYQYDKKEQLCLFFLKLRFLLFYKNIPGPGEFCNAKNIRVVKEPDKSSDMRKYLIFIRCGYAHCLHGDPGDRNFDIALSCYCKPEDNTLADCEYVMSGGMNKYMAARQFLSNDIITRYKGFMFLDDDLEVSFLELSKFFNFCTKHDLNLAQPSLTSDSYTSFKFVVNNPNEVARMVRFVEVMCPYFSTDSLRKALPSFNVNYSTWGIDQTWGKLTGYRSYVVDKFQIKHTKPMDRSGPFYTYMRSIGVLPDEDVAKARSWLNKYMADSSKP